MNKNENEKYEGFGISLIWNITHLLGAWRNCYRTLKHSEWHAAVLDQIQHHLAFRSRKHGRTNCSTLHIYFIESITGFTGQPQPLTPLSLTTYLYYHICLLVMHECSKSNSGKIILSHKCVFLSMEIGSYILNTMPRGLILQLLSLHMQFFILPCHNIISTEKYMKESHWKCILGF